GSRAPAGATRPRAGASRAAGSSQEVGDATGGEPRRTLAVHRTALAAPEHASQPQREEQQRAGVICIGRAAVLAQEAQLTAQVLDEHPALVRGRVDVRRAGPGEEVELPPGQAEAVRPIGLLAEEEEGVVG